MKPKFKLNIFLYVIFGIQFIIYLAWSFIELSFLNPIIDTFSTSESRGFYIMFLFCTAFIGLPFYAPFEKTESSEL